MMIIDMIRQPASASLADMKPHNMFVIAPSLASTWHGTLPYLAREGAIGNMLCSA